MLSWLKIFESEKRGVAWLILKLTLINSILFAFIPIPSSQRAVVGNYEMFSITAKYQNVVYLRFLSNLLISLDCSRIILIRLDLIDSLKVRA